MSPTNATRANERHTLRGDVLFNKGRQWLFVIMSAFAVSFCSFAPVNAGGPSYSIVELGNSSLFADINNNRVIAGHEYVEGDQPNSITSRAFIWKVGDTGDLDKSLYQGDKNSIITQINNRDVAVGTIEENGKTFGARFVNGKAVRLEHADLLPKVINDTGQIAGLWLESLGDERTAGSTPLFRLNPDNRLEVLRHPRNFPFPDLTCIADDGTIAFTPFYEFTLPEAWLWHSNGVAALLDYGKVAKIGPQSQLFVGEKWVVQRKRGFSIRNAAPMPYASYWLGTESGPGQLGVGPESGAKAMNAQGTIVGSTKAKGAFIYFQFTSRFGSGPHLLNKLIKRPKGWTIVDAWDINDTGDIVARVDITSGKKFIGSKTVLLLAQ